ncbi:hypothetical protein C8F04DRAFT_1261191 [Mycena alexandri]|uniref:WW domain-containing protein n=1 Tax=Mycena alexandri TaxID=1745969 RepID=A0AAD6X1G5_9AGAR|nr:hypothetical protein C8F04DRAFT_1261191 [Mycena alexandri]
MADETEVLDWDEEDDARAPFVPADNDEDAVSLGAASDEELDAPDPAPATEDPPSPPPSKTPETAEITPSKRPSPSLRHGHSNSRSRGERDRERHRDDRERDRDRDGHRERRPHKIMQPVTHALPPKPVTTLPALPHGTGHSSSIEATLMAPSSLKDTKDGKPKSSATPNGSGTPGVSAHHANMKSSSTDRDNYKSNTEALPEDWEVRQSRQPTATPNNPNGSTAYFYNTRTNKSTWERPRDDARPRSGDERERDRPQSIRGHHRDGDGPMHTRNSNSGSGGHLDSASGPNEDDGLSYRDRHYRPEGSADLGSGTATPSVPGNGNISDHNRAPPNPPSPPSRGGRGRGRGDSRPGNGRWSPPPNNPNNIRSTSASMSSYPEPLGDFNSSKRPPGWNERDRERKYRDSRDSPPNRDQAARVPHDRGDPERERDQRTLQGQGPSSAGRALDDEPRERRGYASRLEERERRDVRERDREPRDHRERDVPSRDERPRRDADTWTRERERDVPPHQLESRKYDSAYESRKQDGAYGRDAPRNSNSNLTQSQSHPREREPPGPREASMQQRDPPRDRDPQPSMRRDSHRDRDPQPPRSSAHPILSAPSTLTLHPATLLRLRHSYPFRFRAHWW